VGLETQVVGLPPDVTFAKDYTFYHPTGFVEGKYWDESVLPPSVNKTYLNWDYEAVAAGGDGPYNGGTPSNQAVAAEAGPGSDHAAVVNHLKADGSVHTLSREVDSALYMFIITKNNGDPTPSMEE
jgi:hypothetical protein